MYRCCAYQLCGRSGRICYWSENIEHCAHLQLCPGRLSMPDSGMNQRSVQKSNIGLIYAPGNLLGCQPDIHAQTFQYVCASALARHGAISVLGNLDTRTGRDQSRNCRYVERARTVATRSARIEERTACD